MNNIGIMLTCQAATKPGTAFGVRIILIFLAMADHYLYGHGRLVYRRADRIYIPSVLKYKKISNICVHIDFFLSEVIMNEYTF